MRTILLAALLVSGCTSITTEQTESNGIRTTKVSISSFMDSAAKVNKLRTTGTEKTQSVSMTDAGTESSGSNVVTIAIHGLNTAAKLVAP